MVPFPCFCRSVCLRALCQTRALIPLRTRQGGKTYYTLTFTLEAEYDNDLLHVAHCYPYTYTDLQRYIRVRAGPPAAS